MENSICKPLLIYTVGKVSSASIYYACQQETSYHLYHVHYITPEKIKAQSAVADVTGVISADLADAIDFANRRFECNGPIKIINLVRDPIARTLSLFFANGQISNDDLAHFSDNSEKWEHIINVFLNYDRHTELEYWIRHEFEKFTGIDLYKSNYSAKYGWGRHTTKNSTF